MAKSYYGYVKRDVENQVDWASITKEMVTTLEEEQTRREKKKADIDKASREFGKVLTDAEGSSHKALNEFWLDSSSSIQELRRMQDDLLKRGLLDYKSYVSQRQNLTDGSGELINLVKGFDSKWTAVKDDPNASAFDYWNIGNIQGFGNFSDYKTWANPTDGKLSLGKMVLNPKTGQTELSNNPTEYQQISFLKNRMNQRAPKYDYDAAIKKVTENVGRYVKAKSYGAAKTIEDVTKSDAYQKQINTWIDAMIENPFNAGSMLTDWLGYSENYTDDEKQSNEFDLVDTGKVDDNDNPIMMKSYKYVETEVDPVQKGSGLRRPKLKEEQKTQLREAIRNEIESRLDYIETAAPRDTTSAGERTAQQEGEIGFGLALALTSGGGIAGESLEKIKANNNAIDNVYETNTSYIIQYKDGSEDKNINKIMRDGVEAREETAVSLMAAVNPNYDATKAETAKQRYLKSNKIGGRTEKGLFGERTAISTENSSTYQTKSEVAKKELGVSISEQIKNIKDPDVDETSKVNDIVKDIFPLPGTESIMNKIEVSGVGGGLFDKDVLTFKLPTELTPFVKNLTGVTTDGNNITFNYNDKEDNATLRNVIDGIIAGMYDIYNKSDARKTTEDNPDAVPVEAGTTTTTAIGGAGELD